MRRRSGSHKRKEAAESEAPEAAEEAPKPQGSSTGRSRKRARRDSTSTPQPDDEPCLLDARRFPPGPPSNDLTTLLYAWLPEGGAVTEELLGEGAATVRLRDAGTWAICPVGS